MNKTQIYKVLCQALEAYLIIPNTFETTDETLFSGSSLFHKNTVLTSTCIDLFPLLFFMA